MLYSYVAFKAKLGGATVEVRERHAIAKHVVRPANVFGLWLDRKFCIE
jgi:hypothetical protein